MNWGMPLISLVNPIEAIFHFERGLLILERIGDEHGASKIYNNLAGIYYQTDLPAQSIDYLNRTSRNHAVGSAMSGANQPPIKIWASFHYAQGDYDQAILHYQRSLAIKVRLGDNQGIADCHINLGEVFRTQRALSEAIVHLETALKIGLEINSDQTEAECYRQLAECYLETGDLPKAYRRLSRNPQLRSDIRRSVPRRGDLSRAGQDSSTTG